MCARPKFISEGASRFDVEQGELGDSWLLQAVSSLTLTPKFLDRVVPPRSGIRSYILWHIQVKLRLHLGSSVILQATGLAIDKLR